MKADDFSEEQKHYLQGFIAGAELGRAKQGLPTFAAALGLNAPIAAPPTLPEPTGPDAIHIAAQNRFLAEGKKLTPQEEAKRKRHPLDMWDEIQKHAAEGKFPTGTDVLAFKYHGLFYVGPAQEAYMCRLRLPGGIVTSHQFRGIADAADRYGGGYTDVTTRANLQIRQISATSGPDLIIALEEVGVMPRGSGADNLRNVTGSPTAGIDPQELIDTRPLTRAMHFHILHRRELYGLPRKFNIAFDGGGTISALEDTNDIGFSAVRVRPGQAVPEGVYFRLALGGITGHRDFATDEGVIIAPEQCVTVADAIVRVFIEHGDRTDRKKARLKYLLDAWGHEKVLAAAESKLPFKLTRLPLSACEPRPAVAKHGHLGIHPQKQAGRFYIGVLLPVGRLTTPQMRELAAIADEFGSGTIRLTVWQNLLISDIAGEDVAEVKQRIEDIGLHWDAAHMRGSMVACTGNAGCKFAASDTKRHALAIADYLQDRVKLNHPINIHLTGCPHSCAQHYLGDIGLLGAGVDNGSEMVEGYHIFVGGGYGADQSIGREVFRSIAASDVPSVIEMMLRVYLQERNSERESFNEFIRRHSTEELRQMFSTHSVAVS